MQKSSGMLAHLRDDVLLHHVLVERGGGQVHGKAQKRYALHYVVWHVPRVLGFRLTCGIPSPLLHFITDG